MNAATRFDILPERAETQRGLVAVAMSGGVDSSAVAALLQQQGRDVVGLTMQLWNQRRLPQLQGDGPPQHRCCSLDDVYDAKAVAQHLNFPHYVVNFEEQFEARVVRPFVDQYLAGRTPIACTNCNTDVKFEPLLRMARQIGAECLATGNYGQFIQAYSRERRITLQGGEGEIVNENGDVIGRHNGVHNFTIGQRKGLGFATGKPVYVLSIDPEKNRVVVGEDNVLRKTVCEIEGVNWISCDLPPGPLRAFAKIRHKHEPAPATIEPLDAATARVTFDTPQRAITPGQATVFYDDVVVLGTSCIR